MTYGRAQAQEPILGEDVFHQVYILMHPLDVPNGVSLIAVDPINRGGGFGEVPFFVQDDRESRQGTFELLCLQQTPKLLNANGNRDTPFLCAGQHPTVEGTRQFPYPFPAKASATTTMVGLVLQQLLPYFLRHTTTRAMANEPCDRLCNLPVRGCGYGFHANNCKLVIHLTNFDGLAESAVTHRAV
jgi:hypothetical protein